MKESTTEFEPVKDSFADVDFLENIEEFENDSPVKYRQLAVAQINLSDTSELEQEIEHKR